MIKISTTELKIRSIEWSSNPTSTGQAILLKISVVKAITDTIRCNSNALYMPAICGQQITTESILTP